ncbi:MAG: hypothetical protein QM775_10070 [Pirellulales bacterium]
MHGVGGNGRVHRVTAAPQDVEPRLRRQRLARGDHAASGDYDGPPFSGKRFRSIEARPIGGVNLGNGHECDEGSESDAQ